MCCTIVKSLVQFSLFSFLFIQIGIAGTLRQSIRLSHNRAAHDLQVKIQIPYHPTDHCQLLGILLAKIRPVRRYDMEQL